MLERSDSQCFLCYSSITYIMLSVEAHSLVASTKPVWMLLLCWFRIYILHFEDQIV